MIAAHARKRSCLLPPPALGECSIKRIAVAVATSREGHRKKEVPAGRHEAPLLPLPDQQPRLALVQVKLLNGNAVAHVNRPLQGVVNLAPAGSRLIGDGLSVPSGTIARSNKGSNPAYHLGLSQQGRVTLIRHDDDLKLVAPFQHFIQGGPGQHI